MTDTRHVVIMAGGAGTRLWPLSRQARPKHFLRLIDGKSLLRLAYERLASFLPAEHIHVITSAAHLDLVAAEIPELPCENLIGEPTVRDTANAVALSALILHQRDPEGLMGVFTADHVIRPVERFKAALENAFRAATDHPQALVTLGVKPRTPHTGYGYVQRGELVSPGVYYVRQFKEKPDLQTAQSYLASGDYYWNSGMFVWRTATILQEIARHLPQNYQTLSRISQVRSPAERQRMIEQIYPSLPKVSIDYGVMEKAENVLVCELDCEWLDVGAWTSLAEIIHPDAHGNVRAHANVVALDSTNNIFVGEDEHLIAAIGLEDMVIVRSSNATLVCRRQDVQKLKDLVSGLVEKYL